MNSIPKQIQEVFFHRLESQTNWGRTQLKQLYLEVVADVFYHSENTKDLDIKYSKPVTKSEVESVDFTYAEKYDQHKSEIDDKPF